MTIDLTDQELKFISEALAAMGDNMTERGERYREFKALRLKIDSALLIGAMEEKK